MYLVSACLAGFNCKYNGGNNYNEKIFNLVREGKAIPVCPEQLGGLTTPRAPAEIILKNNKRHIINSDNVDVTKNYEKGSEEVLNIAKRFKIKKAILQARNPACGVGRIYNGEFNKTLVDGDGILAELLIKNNIEVINSEDI